MAKEDQEPRRLGQEEQAIFVGDLFPDASRGDQTLGGWQIPEVDSSANNSRRVSPKYSGHDQEIRSKLVDYTHEQAWTHNGPMWPFTPEANKRRTQESEKLKTKTRSGEWPAVRTDGDERDEFQRRLVAGEMARNAAYSYRRGMEARKQDQSLLNGKTDVNQAVIDINAQHLEQHVFLPGMKPEEGYTNKVIRTDEDYALIDFNTEALRFANKRFRAQGEKLATDEMHKGHKLATATNLHMSAVEIPKPMEGIRLVFEKFVNFLGISTKRGRQLKRFDAMRKQEESYTGEAAKWRTRADEVITNRDERRRVLGGSIVEEASK